MSAARWSLRLPRASAHLTEARLPRNAIRRVDQRRWLQKAPPRRRTWANTGRSKAQDEQSALEQMKKSYGASQASKQTQQPEQQGEQQGEQQAEQPAQPGKNTQLAETLSQSHSPDLIAPVHIPKDPHGVLPPDHPALAILGNSSLVIQRQVEMMNLVIGFEQANRYVIMSGDGTTLGYIAEQDHGIGSTMKRQFFKTHRSFTTHIFDTQEREVLRIHRPFAYINSRIRIYDPVPEGGYADREMATSTTLQGTSAKSAADQAAVAQVSPLALDEMRIIGEAQQQWAPLRRKYNLFSYRPLTPAPKDSTQPRLSSGDAPETSTTALTESTTPDRAIEAGMSQFAHISEPFLSWDFTLRNDTQETIGSVNRNFAGFAREIFTDTGVYALRMDSAAQSASLESTDGKEIERYERDATAMTLDQRAVMLATAVSVDFDYFSRHSSAGGGGMGFMPIWFPWGGGAAAEGGAAGAGAAGAGVGAAEAGGALEGAAGTAGRMGAGAAGEGAMVGAGSMAGYEAMQRGAYGPRGGDDASPQAGNEPFSGASPGGQGPPADGGDTWGESQDPWGGGQGGDGGGDGFWGGDDGPPAPPPAGGGGEGGGGWGDMLSDFLSD